MTYTTIRLWAAAASAAALLVAGTSPPSRAQEAPAAATEPATTATEPGAAASPSTSQDTTPPSQAALTPEFETWLQGVRDEGLQRGLKQSTIDAALTGLVPIPRVIELDRKQPEFTMTLQDYMARVVSPARIERGRELMREHRALLAEVEAKFHVQRRFVVALWGIETDFGRLKGGFPVVQALATLAFDGRRSAYFRRELFDALSIIDQGHITPEAMIGSWAGAMGQNQFMPSSFLRYAVDHDGDGRRDIWTNHADVFASTANYLRTVGWRDDLTWGRPVRVPKGFDYGLAKLEIQKPIEEWHSLGVRRTDGSALPSRNLSASIIVPGGNSGPAFMIYENFRVILKWNRAQFFATAVGSLADRLAGG
jgi:membrane-bound lytic murein transglycosylase B